MATSDAKSDTIQEQQYLPKPATEDWKFLTYDEYAASCRTSPSVAGTLGPKSMGSLYPEHFEAQHTCKELGNIIDSIDSTTSVADFDQRWARTQAALASGNRRMMELYDAGNGNVTVFHAALLMGNVDLATHILRLAGTKLNRRRLINMIAQDLDAIQMIIATLPGVNMTKTIETIQSLIALIKSDHVNYYAMKRDIHDQ